MTDAKVAAEQCSAVPAAGHMLEAFPSRDVSLGSLHVTRALPIRSRRMVGPWCFLDRYGPLTFSNAKPMDVAPHPHTGLQTVTWLLDGEVLHNDSLGSEALARPGDVNVMTAGSGIAHAEETPASNTGRLNGLQLWVALPEARRHTDPSFQHVNSVAMAEPRGALVKVFAGSLSGVTSAARYYSDIVGAEINVHAGETCEIAVDAAHEHALLLLGGDCSVEHEPLQERTLYYLGTSRHSVAFDSTEGATLALVGGAPFPETILMWWNFVARTPEEIADARADWEAHRRFGDVRAYRGPRLDAPPLVRLARPKPLS